ncbi:CCA tRNA nucleotidyltransferase [Paenibacillus sp. YPG26]|uniref:CCA tRNA nucleotidyltransferase n=1 Tax=Paenibacillus sp. YPG26 TaxID=2878915 RepID=UPI00203E45F7|nr:CCA tRNA nucleotidyltransferase [Paenibacillus sp. YPG26]USB35050.1 CCA tRNA nucleotidyltransferase [Paenibacillus sp. YPG26]
MKQWSQVDARVVSAGEEVLRRLEDAGHKAYWVGGCVRDEVMGRPVHDMDIATSARPEMVIQLFERCIPTGLQHGTVTVLINKQAFEVTTFRKETEYEDHRRPAAVEFVDAVLEDLKRRDFTMNAMAMDIDGNLIDPFCGREDIKAGVIRCVGEADERFEEDALRMVRAIRFASVFGFTPTLSTWRAVIRNRDKMDYIAIERIRAEFEKILYGPDPLRGLELLSRSQLLENSKLPTVQVQTQPDMLRKLPLLPAVPADLRLSLLVQGLGIETESIPGLLKKWTFPNRDAEGTVSLIRFDQEWMEQLRARNSRSAEEIEKSLRPHWVVLELAYGQGTAGLWISRMQTLLESTNRTDHLLPINREQLKILEDWHTAIPVHHVRELKVKGNEVLEESGRPGGPWLGSLMKQLLYSVAAGDVPNTKEDLLNEVKRMVNLSEA